MILYHITKEEYIPSIIRFGILPSFKNGITCSKIKHNYVFLTNDINKIFCNQIGKTASLKYNCLITVDVENYKPYIYQGFIIPKISDFEFIIDKVEINQIKNIEVISWNKNW